jgi:hypothetical protein
MSTYEHVCGACGRPDTPRVWRSGEVWVRQEDLDVANRLLDLAGHGGLPAVDRLAELSGGAR